MADFCLLSPLIAFLKRNLPLMFILSMTGNFLLFEYYLELTLAYSFVHHVVFLDHLFNIIHQ